MFIEIMPTSRMEISPTAFRLVWTPRGRLPYITGHMTGVRHALSAVGIGRELRRGFDEWRWKGRRGDQRAKRFDKLALGGFGVGAALRTTPFGVRR